ncbi:MAG TPA: hypothetical protein VLJ14_10010 [Ktedonobacterales bacterium]|jgi:hypothetical protein|nr:hypothetical protein [Ktedonobacterales bacterium]
MREDVTMSMQRDPYRMNSGRAYPGAGGQARKLPLASLIHRTLVSVAEREQQRARLIAVLILVQALMTVAVAVGYTGARTAPLVFALTAGALAVYGAAFAANRWFRRVAVAAYILVIGGSLAVAAQAVAFALAGHPQDAAHYALLFIPIILDAGLLFVPEVTLITACATATLAAFAILFALSLQPVLDKHVAYQLVVYTVGMQAVAGLVAWLLAQFILESSVEMQRAQELQFAQARYEALAMQVDETEGLLVLSAARMQQAIGRALGGEYLTQVEIPDGELAPLAESLNLLLARYEAVARAEQERSLVDASVLPLLDNISRMAEAGTATPTPTSLPVMTNTPLDSVSLALSQMQLVMAKRMTHMQRLAAEVVGGVTHSEKPLPEVSKAVRESLRIAGVLIATADATVGAAQRQLATLEGARRALAAVLPGEVTRMPAEEAGRREAAAGLDALSPADLRGLGHDLGIGSPGYTEQYEALWSQDAAGGSAGIAPLTVPIRALSPDEGDPPTGAAGVFAAGELPAELVDAWNLLLQMDMECRALERALVQLGREVGVQSRLLRSADAGIAWFDGALVAVRSNAEQLQHLAGAGMPVPGIAEAAPSRPLEPSGQARQPEGVPHSRPLAPSTPLDRLDRDGRMPADPTPYGTNAQGAPATSGPLGAAGGTGIPYAPGSLRAADLLGLGDAGGNDSLAGLPGLPGMPGMAADFFAEQEQERRDEA